MDENGEKNYSKREIDHYFKDLFNRLDKQDGSLSKILEQTIKTNGRVNRLEYWQGALKWAFGLGFPILMTIIIKVFI